MKLFTLLLFISLQTVKAGERDTHGGGAIVCFNPIITVELLDLWEGETFQLYKFPNYVGDVDQQLVQIFNQMSKYVDVTFLNKLKNYTKDIKRTAFFIKESDGVAISPPADAKNGLYKNHCKLLGLAMFRSEPGYFGELWIDDSFFQLLNDFNKAALLIHEAIYKILRDEVGATNSVLARKITANLLSLNAQERYFTGDTYICSDLIGENSLYITKQWTDRHVPGGEFVTRAHLINAYSETVHPGTLQDFHIPFELFFEKMPEYLIFDLTGRPSGSNITFRYMGNPRLYVAGVSFPHVKCKLR